MQLSDHTHTAAALIVDGNESFDTDLEIISNPDHARTDESGRHEVIAKIVGDRGHQADFDDCDEVIDEVRQPEVDDVRVQVGQAVLQRAAVGHGLGDERASHKIERAGGNVVASLEGDGERPGPAQWIGEFAKALTYIEGRRQRAERAPIPALVAPVPPQSTMSPTIKASSCGPSLRSWY